MHRRRPSGLGVRGDLAHLKRVEQARAGDRQAVDLLAAAVVDRLYSVARLVLRDTDRAEDAVQETVVRLDWPSQPRRQVAPCTTSNAATSLASATPHTALRTAPSTPRSCSASRASRGGARSSTISCRRLRPTG